MLISVIAVGTGSAVADGVGSAHESLGDEAPLKPIDPDNETEYRAYEPSPDQLEMPVDMESAPETVTSPDGAASEEGSASASATSIVWNDSDTDPAVVGTTKFFLGTDFAQFELYLKRFTLVSIGDELEVWVANDMTWPADDPRPDPTLSEDQAERLAREFDTRMYPPETDVFGTPVPRNGSDSPLAGNLDGLPDDYSETGDGSNRSVFLVDNVRDQNYYDHTFPLFVGGFYAPPIQRLTDRNVITLDRFNWDPITGPQAVTGKESTLAHEYQHLIHGDLDSDETSWINEGMSMYAEVITGYGIPGHLDHYEESPSNSLVNWEDQGFLNILADYGVAFTFQMYLEDEFGQEFISTLARDEANGIASVENTLDAVGDDRRFEDLFQDFSTAVVTDSIPLPPKEQDHFDNLDVSVNTSREVGTAGVYGPAYTTIDTSDRGPITDVTVTGIDFLGTNWDTATDPVTGEGQVLYSGSGNLLNRFAILETNLSGAQDPTLTFDSFQRIEENWDYGFVQVSTDGGETWTSLSSAKTDDSPNPRAHPLVKANLPGLTGDTTGWESQTVDLSAYQGQEDVLVAFRYVTDWALIEPGWWIKDVSLAGEPVPTDTTGPYLSLREATEDRIRYQFSFIGVKHNGNYQVKQLDVTTFDESQKQELLQFLHNGNFERVIVVANRAAGMGESGRVPIGVQFEFAGEGGNGNSGGDDTAGGNGNSGGDDTAGGNGNSGGHANSG